MEATDKIMQRIERLLAMADDKASPHEAEIAARRATKLMNEYNVELANVIAHTKELEGKDIVDQAISDLTYKRWPQHLQTLSVAVARLCDCHVKFRWMLEETTTKAKIWIYGHKNDVQVACWLYAHILRSADSAADDYATERYNAYLPTNRAQFHKGFISECRTRLNKLNAEKRAAQARDLQALVVVKQDAITNKYGDFGYKKSRTRTRADQAYMEGWAQGSAVNLDVNALEQREQHARMESD